MKKTIETDYDLSENKRVYGNFWKMKYLEAYKELVKANKGIRRLRRRLARAPISSSSERANAAGWKECDSCVCNNCKSTKVHHCVVESSCGGYEDYRHECKTCGHKWWVEGIDS